MMMMETTATLTVGCFDGSDGGDGRQCICRRATYDDDDVRAV